MSSGCGPSGGQSNDEPAANLDYLAQDGNDLSVTTGLVADGVRDWLAGQGAAELSAVSWVVEDASTAKGYPLVTVAETGSQEHDVLVGVYEVSVEVALETNPTDTDEAAAKAMKDALYGLVGDRRRMISGLDDRADLQCWEARTVGMSTTAEDGRRRDAFTLTVVAAAQV